MKCINRFGEEKSALLGHMFGEYRYCCAAAGVLEQHTYASWIKQYEKSTIEELKTLLKEQESFIKGQYGGQNATVN